MDQAIDNPIEIREGMFANDNTNIMPVRRNNDSFPSIVKYSEKADEVISISCFYLDGIIEHLLVKYFSEDTQLTENGEEPQIKYEVFGENYYTRDQITCLLSELKTYTDETDETDCRKDFYYRFIDRMEKMLRNMDGYDLILFFGP